MRYKEFNGNPNVIDARDLFTKKDPTLSFVDKVSQAVDSVNQTFTDQKQYEKYISDRLKAIEAIPNKSLNGEGITLLEPVTKIYQDNIPFTKAIWLTLQSRDDSLPGEKEAYMAATLMMKSKGVVDRIKRIIQTQLEHMVALDREIKKMPNSELLLKHTKFRDTLRYLGALQSFFGKPDDK
jgi:hypothetical protein